ncbi:MAG: hypothetical protein Q7R33_01950 [Nitrosarchaeum sp.]|nr:hypothetical protein [Nitrosarchaeum sp.]
MAKKAFVQKGDDPSMGQFVDFYKFMQIGRIIRVDNEKNLVDIQFASNPTISKDVPITSPFYTGRAFIGGMPEEGSLVLCGFVKLTNKIGFPIIVAYLNNEYFRALNYVYTNGKTSAEVKELKTIHEKIGYDVRRLKIRKLYPGDINLESTQGSGIVLDDGISISDSKLNEIILSSADRSIYSNSINNNVYTNASRILNGLIVRQNAPSIEPIIMENGRPLYIVTDGQSIDENGLALTEIRTEVRETANAILDVIESYDAKDFADDSSEGRLLVSQMLGTLVGNEKKYLDLYGKVLRPQIFAAEGNSIVIADMPCRPNEIFNLASAYQLKFASNTKFDIDKEGHAFVHLAASTAAHPLGPGRSLEFAADGSIKLVIGKENVAERSLDLSTSGKVLLNFGSSSSTLRSCEWTLDRALYIKVNAPDTDGYAINEEYFGNALETIHGTKTITIDGSLIYNVKGKIQENVLGAKVQNYVNDMMTNYGGDYQEIVAGKRQSKYGKGSKTDIATEGTEETIIQGNKKETLTLGNKEVTLVAGSSKETLTLGNKETKIVAGNIKDTVITGSIEESVTLGNHKISVATGNIEENVTLGSSKESIATGDKTITIKLGKFEVSITAGNIAIKTTAGTVDVNSVSQKVTINGMLGVDIKSSVKVNVSAPLVDIGSSQVRGGVITTLSHLDYVTGAPLLGSFTVKASS